MTDSMNKPEIETLSYKPSKLRCRGRKTIYPERIDNEFGETFQPKSYPCPGCIDCQETKPEQPKDGILVPIFVPNQLIEHLPSREHIKECKCGQCPEQPKCKICGNPQRKDRKGWPIRYCGKPCPPAHEQPNQQIMLIKTIQGLTTAILDDISKLPESELKDQAYDDMNMFETGVLFRLQKEYE